MYAEGKHIDYLMAVKTVFYAHTKKEPATDYFHLKIVEACLLSDAFER
jgi:hypothetical protein